jgi:hypothetical protein
MAEGAVLAREAQMAVTVAFAGIKPVPATGASLLVWSYTVESAPPLQTGQGVALAFPAGSDLRDPQDFPGLADLAGTFLEASHGASRQYVGRVVQQVGRQTLAVVAPGRPGPQQSSCELMLVTRPQGNQPWVAQPFNPPGGAAAPAHVLTGPSAGALPGPFVPPGHGRPASQFAGVLPYASEMFGVFAPLGGWLGRSSMIRALPAEVTERLLRGGDAVDHERLRTLAAAVDPELRVLMTPVGLINLFREYFFEFDTFLGMPVGHVWISPGGTVELVESSTRRTLVERTAEQSEEAVRRIEESLTDQDDVADAVKEDNANDTKLGVSASGGANVGIYHGEASASLNIESSVKRSSEATHKHTRTQSSKVSSEIKRNYKTTFRTVTETTDTTSRRYVVQNTTANLVNYELRRKMRKVGVQVQHIGSRMCWQVHLDRPGRDIGLGDLVHLVPEPDLTSVKPAEVLPPPEPRQMPFRSAIPFLQHHGGGPDTDLTYVTSDENANHGIYRTDGGENNIILFRHDFTLPPPPPGYVLSALGPFDFHGAMVKYTLTEPDLGVNPNPALNRFAIRLTLANFGGKTSMPFDTTLIYQPTDELKNSITQTNNRAKAEYEAQVAARRRQAYTEAVRDRLRLVSGIVPRPNEDLRREERHSVYGRLIRQLDLLPNDAHANAELVRQLFDVDEMLFFTAPEYWRPSVQVVHPSESSQGKYPVPRSPLGGGGGGSGPLAGDTVVSWYSYTDKNNAVAPNGTVSDEWRINYLLTEETQPAPMGSSLGWLIQSDGDVRRNEFLNAAWVKAVLPIRPGREADALAWLKRAEVEGTAGLAEDYPFQPGDPTRYQGRTIGWVLDDVAGELAAVNTAIANTLATETVFENGFDPLAGGFRPAEPYQVFDQWIEVLPTDQVVAAEVSYDPRTGTQL